MAEPTKEQMKVPWQCRWFGHDWNTHVGFPMRRDCERCGFAQIEKRNVSGNYGGLPTRWITDETD